MAQSSPDMPSSKQNVALKTSPSREELTPPDSPTKRTVSSQMIVEDLQYLFGVFLQKALLYLTNQEPPNTPVSRDQSPPGPDMVRLRQLLEKFTCDERASAKLSAATKPAQACPAKNKQEGVQVADAIDLDSPICTTPDDFKSFEKWASTPKFKTVVETYELPTLLLMPFRSWLTWV